MNKKVRFFIADTCEKHL